MLQNPKGPEKGFMILIFFDIRLLYIQSFLFNTVGILDSTSEEKRYIRNLTIYPNYIAFYQGGGRVRKQQFFMKRPTLIL